MASKKGPEDGDSLPDEQAGEELKGENGSETTLAEVVAKEGSGKKSKKKRGKKRQEQDPGAPVSAGEATAVRSMRELLTKLGVSEQTDGDKSHAFWDTQPVPKLGECPRQRIASGDGGGGSCAHSISTDDKVDEYGPIEVEKDSIRQQPLTLPEKFEWDIVDVLNDEQVCGCECVDVSV